jgi:hypothetical protein
MYNQHIIIWLSQITFTPTMNKLSTEDAVLKQ